MSIRRCAARVVLLLACGAWLSWSRAAAAPAPGDDWSFANVQQFRTRHIELSLTLDFDVQQLQGAIAMELDRLDPQATQLILDTRDLTILGVSVQSADIVGATEHLAPLWISLPFHLGKADPIRGSPLVIDLPASREPLLVLRIDYETAPKARGLRWHLPAPAAKHDARMLYTLSAPINARSWIPLQDSPQVRMTWRVHVHTDHGLTVVMPGVAQHAKDNRGEDWFAMQQPVPPAALALVIGELRMKPLGARSVVFAGDASTAARAFGDVEPLLQAGEKLLGRYPFERFQVVVMPTAFPVADMDYPGTALVSPTLVAGHVAQPGLLADALAQSWIGARLAGPDWRDRWIGEAVAGWFAARMLATLHGATSAAMPAAAAAETPLVADLQGAGYDDIFNAVPRTRGRQFFDWLATRVGPERIDALLNEFLQRPKGEEATTENLLSFLQQRLADGKAAAPTRAELDDWLYATGTPAVAAGTAATATQAAAALAGSDLKGLAVQLRQWPAASLAAALDAVPDSIDAGRLAALDRELALSATPDAVVGSAWFALCLRAGYAPALIPLEHYLLTTGRLDLIEPLYEQLAASESGLTWARRVFALSRPGLDLFVARRLQEIVHP